MFVPCTHPHIRHHRWPCWPVVASERAIRKQRPTCGFSLFGSTTCCSVTSRSMGDRRLMPKDGRRAAARPPGKPASGRSAKRSGLPAGRDSLKHDGQQRLASRFDIATCFVQFLHSSEIKNVDAVMLVGADGLQEYVMYAAACVPVVHRPCMHPGYGLKQSSCLLNLHAMQ